MFQVQFMKKTAAVFIVLVMTAGYFSVVSGLLTDDVIRYSGRSGAPVNFVSPASSAETVFTDDGKFSGEEILDKIISDKQIIETQAEDMFFTITKPEDLSKEQTVLRKKYLLCGQLHNQDIKVTIAVYNDKAKAYEEMKFQEDGRGITTSEKGFFTQELALKDGVNDFKVIAYVEDAFSEDMYGTYDELYEELVESNSFQVKYFTIISLNESVKLQILNRLNTHDYFLRVNEKLSEGMED